MHCKRLLASQSGGFTRGVGNAEIDIRRQPFPPKSW